MSDDFHLFTVFNRDKAHLCSNVYGFFWLKQLRVQGGEQLRQLPVGEDSQFARIGAAGNPLANQAQHPDNPQQMVYVLMCDKDIPDLFPVNFRSVKLFEEAVSALTFIKYRHTPQTQNRVYRSLRARFPFRAL